MGSKAEADNKLEGLTLVLPTLVRITPNFLLATPRGLFSSPRLCGHFDTTGHLLRQAGLPSVSPGASPAPFSVFRVLRPPVITPAGRGPLGLRRLSGKRNLQDYTKRRLVYRITYCIGSNNGDRNLQYNKYNKTRGTE